MADHYRLTANKLARQLFQSIKFIFGPAVFDHNAGALDIARFTQAPTEARYAVIIGICPSAAPLCPAALVPPTATRLPRRRAAI
jgi:hypothetical protein